MIVEKVCSNCIMDTSDPEITFNSKGICNHCINFSEVTSKNWHPNDDGLKKLKKIVDNIKKERREKNTIAYLVSVVVSIVHI